MRNKIIFTGTIAVSLLAGCGDKAPSVAATAATTAPPAVTTATVAPVPTSAGADANAELKAAVQAYSDAYLTGEGKKAYALLSARCQKRMPLDRFTGLVAAGKQMYGSALPFQTFDAKVSGDLARVTYTYAVKAIDQDSEPWVRESGSWHEDDC